MLKIKKYSTETALSPREIINLSFPTDKRNSKWVAPARTEVTRRGYCVYTVTKNPGERSRTHKVLINMPVDYKGSFNRCPEVKLLCDCKRNLFVWNFAQDEHGIAIKNVTNFEPPVITNPAEVPGCCKHTLVALRLLLRANPRWVSPASVAQEAAKAYDNNPIKLTNLRDTLTRIRGGKPTPDNT